MEYANGELYTIDYSDSIAGMTLFSDTNKENIKLCFEVIKILPEEKVTQLLEALVNHNQEKVHKIITPIIQALVSKDALKT